MRVGILTIVTLLACISKAENLPPQLEKVAEFVTKKGACLFAVAEVPRDEKLFKNAYSPAWRNQLLCVQDLTSKAGTIDESKGCALTWYDSEIDNYLPVQTMDSFGRAEITIAKGKPCASGGFSELLKMKLGTYGASSVLGKLTKPSNSQSKLIILVSSSSELKKIVEKHLIEAEAQIKAAESKAAEKKKANDLKTKASDEKKRKEEKEALAKIEGFWIGPCKDKDGSSDRQSMNFNNGKFEVTIDSFKSTGCIQAKRYERITMTGRYKVGPVVNAKDGTKALDITNQGAKFHIYDKEYAEQVSESSKFGLVTVIPNRDYDITTSKELASIIGKTTYGLFKLNEMDLNLDKESSGLDSDPKNRSKLQIDSSATYKRQIKRSSSESDENQDSNSGEH